MGDRNNNTINFIGPNEYDFLKLVKLYVTHHIQIGDRTSSPYCIKKGTLNFNICIKKGTLMSEISIRLFYGLHQKDSKL